MNRHHRYDSTPGVDPTDDTTMTKEERNDMAKQPTGPVKGAGENRPWNDKGMGAETHYRMDMLPQRALLAMAELRHRAIEKHGESGIDEWRSTRSQLQLSRGLTHDSAFLIGDTSERNGDPLEHLVHSCLRHLFALEIELARREYDERETMTVSLKCVDEATPALRTVQLSLQELAQRMSIDLAIGSNYGGKLTAQKLQDYLETVLPDAVGKGNV